MRIIFTIIVIMIEGALVLVASTIFKYSALTGIIIWVVVGGITGAISDSWKEGKEDKASKKKCVACAETILKEAKKCRYCGEKQT